MTSIPVSRRQMLGAAAAAPLAWLAGCSTPLPLTAPSPASQADAEQLLRDSAEAHGLSAYRQFGDVNLRLEGQWRPFVDRVQPVLVDKPFRSGSEERLMPAAGIVAQAHRGEAGRKHVVWQRGAHTPEQPGEASVWFNGARSVDPDVEAAAALVAEGYSLFLFGPMTLVDRGLAMVRDGTERVDGRLCDVVQVWLRPGLGRVALDRIAACIDPTSGLMRRVRFTLEGFANTQGTVAEVDCFEHQRRFGVMWPMRWYEEVVHPLRLPAHDWHLAGLDANRGYAASDITGPEFTGRAAASAAAL